MPKPVRAGLWRRVPPAVFPPILGAMGLALVWRLTAGPFALPRALGELGAGVMVLLFLFAALAYATKLFRRPAVLAEELTILPGRAGVGAAALCIYMLAALLAPYAPQLAHVVLVGGMAVHVSVLAVLLNFYRTCAPEQRRVTPVWHLNWVGFIVAARVALLLDWPELAGFVLWPALAVASVIWAISARQFIAGAPPAPLRPMLAIHAAPAALIGAVAAGLGWNALALTLGIAAGGYLLILALSARWLLAAGFSPLWGALTFPLSTTAGIWTILAMQGGDGARLIAAIFVVLASFVIPPILFLILREWASGRLAARTNAAIA